MARAVALAGFVALAAGQGLALPTLETTTQHLGEWEEAAVEAQRAAAASVDETINNTEGLTTVPRMMGTSETTQQVAVQEAVLDAIMREVQTIFKNTLTVPGWDNMDSAAETVKQIVERVRERLNSSMTDGETGRTTMTTAAALRGVTNDFLKEIMVQEAVIETLWAVLRDSQARPWITNEQQAMHIAATQAVQGFLARMQDRLRATGFTDEEIMKMLPRTKTCNREGLNGMFDTCPERNLGKKGGYRSYGYGYAYPVWGYPVYGYGFGYPYYGYGFRRLGEMTTPETTPNPMTFPTGMPTPVTGQMGSPLTTGLTNMTGMTGTTGMTRPELMGPVTGVDRLAERMLQHGGWGHGGHGGWGHGGHGGWGHGGHGGWGHGGWGHGGWGHGGWGHGGWGHHGGWGYPYYRRLEVPELTNLRQSSTAVPTESLTENTHSTGRTTGFTQTSFRRMGETRIPMTTGSYYTSSQNTPVNMETPFYPDQTMETMQNTWETYN